MLDLGNSENSARESMVLGMVLLRSEPNPKRDLCDCNPNCILGFNDLVLCAFDGLIPEYRPANSPASKAALCSVVSNPETTVPWFPISR